MNRSCELCVFRDVCPGSRPCNHFSPLDDIEMLEAENSSNKDEYYQAWLEYIQDFD